MAKSLTVKIVDAFVSGGTGGNGAGVVLDADSLTDLEMQRIAAAVGLSATAFVSASDTEAFKLDFFTPNSRIAHCGHATVATFRIWLQSAVWRRAIRPKKPSKARARLSCATEPHSWNNSPQIIGSKPIGRTQMSPTPQF